MSSVVLVDNLCLTVDHTFDSQAYASHTYLQDDRAPKSWLIVQKTTKAIVTLCQIGD